MAIQHEIAGPATVKVDTYSGGQAQGFNVSLGINRGSIPVIIQPKFLDVPSDDWGGEEGVPADAQMLGAIAVVQLSLTKFDKTYCDKILDGYMKLTTGTPETITTNYEAGKFLEFGEFVRQGGNMLKLTIDSQTASSRSAKNWVFDYAFVRGGGAVGHGTRYSSMDFQFECWLDATTTRKLYTISYA